MGKIRDSIKSVPWVAVRNVAFALRKAFAHKEVPEQEHVVVDKNIQELEDIFRHNHYREGWAVSWYYLGEDKNVSRAEYNPGGVVDNYQHHVRMFKVDGGTTIIYTHYEIDPIMHPRKHMNAVDYDVGEGVRMTTSLLEKEGVGYEITDAGNHYEH